MAFRRDDGNTCCCRRRAGGAAILPVGVTVNQAFKLFSHEFHGYLPPEDWTFSGNGDPPLAS